MRVQVVDPSAYTPAYDHALCSALAHEGASVELITSAFAYGAAPAPDGYTLRELFYRRSFGPPGSQLRLASKLLEHVPDMLRYRRAALAADVVHFQWLSVQSLDRHLLPRRPTVLTAHDLLPREPRPTQVGAQRGLYDAVDAVVTHSQYGRRQLVERLGVDAAKVSVIHHGAFDYLTRVFPRVIPRELHPTQRRAVLFFGLLRPYKGLDVLLDAWRQLDVDAELWIVGRPRVDIAPLVAGAPSGVRWVTRYVSDQELAGCFSAAAAVVLPYVETERLDFSGVLATALAFGSPSVVSDVGGFGEVAEVGAARLVPPGEPAELATALSELLSDEGARLRLAEGARRAAIGPYSWAEAARRTLALYRALAR
jgi:glycosyltransferase involved in cell wall biosynthesis